MIELPSLFAHQESFRDALRSALAKHVRVIACAQTGFGKTRTAKWILGASVNREPTAKQSGKSLFTVHRRGLVDNASDSLEESPAVPHGIIMSGRETAYGRRVQVASIDTLLNWFIENGAYPSDITFDLIVWDEAHSHHTKFARFLAAHEARRESLGLNPSYVIGLTATPQAKGLADVYREIVLGPSTEWLVANGFLSPFRYFRGTLGKLGLLVRKGGEYTKDSEAAAMDGLAGDLVRDWQKYAEGRPTVGFFPRRSHAQDAMAKLSEAGLRVEYVDGETPDEDRRRIFRQLNNHDIDYLCNVQVVERGTDIPRIGCIQLCVAVGSIVRYRQMIGRGSRVHPEKTDCLVLDHGGNVARHGFFEDDPEWSLDITTKDPGEQGSRPTIECPKCCLSRGTMVLTDRGEVPIQDVKIADRVWDGIEFCCHGGTRCNGIREVIDWGGLILTPDHKVLTNGGWKEAEEAKGGHWRPIVGGVGGTPIRTTDDSNPYHSIQGENAGSRGRLLSVWKERMEAVSQNFSSTASRLRALHGEVRRGLPCMAHAASQPAEVAVSMPRAYRLQQLRRSRDRVSVCLDSGWSSVDCDESWTSAKQIVDHRSHRQQRPLRTWKYPLGDNADTREQPEARLEIAIQAAVSVRDVWRGAANEPMGQGIQSTADSRSMDRKVRGLQVVRNEGAESCGEAGISICEVQQTACGEADSEWNDSEADRQPMVVEVWDIQDAGPRNRYCANGVIVSNCRIYRGGKCVCGYEPTQKERRSQGLEFDGTELKEFKREEKKETAGKTAEQLMVSALYMSGKSGRTWRQCCGIFRSLCEKQGTPTLRVPANVTVAGNRYSMPRYGSDDSARKVGTLFPFTLGNGHGGEYKAKETQSSEVQW